MDERTQRQINAYLYYLKQLAVTLKRNGEGLAALEAQYSAIVLVLLKMGWDGQLEEQYVLPHLMPEGWKHLNGIKKRPG